jgi:acetyl esterase/lipase
MRQHADQAARHPARWIDRRHRGAAIAATVAAGLVALTGCSSSGQTDSAAASTAASPASTTCPADPGGGPAGGGALPSGVPGGGALPSGIPGGAASGAAGGIPTAKTIKATDTSTSIVINPTGAQIQCGKTQLTSFNDIVYSSPSTNGKTTDLKLDLQTPGTSGAKPLVVYITGGGFQMASKTANLNQRTYVAEQGYVVASIEYRTVANDATYADAVADVKSAVRYLRAHAAQYGIDKDNVAVWGQSAGGYLAAMTGTTNGVKKFDVGDNLDQSSDVQGVVDEFGPSNLSELAADYDTAAKEANYVAGNSAAKWVYGPGTKKSIAQYTSQIAAANPITYISSKTAPFVLLHGSADHLVSPSQTLIVHTALRAKGIDSTRYVLTGADHGDLSFTGNATAAKPWSTVETMSHIVDFLSKHLTS